MRVAEASSHPRAVMRSTIAINNWIAGLAVQTNARLVPRCDPGRVATYLNLLEPESLVRRFVAHPPQAFEAFVSPEGAPRLRPASTF